jgi:hypothetical protein
MLPAARLTASVASERRISASLLRMTTRYHRFAGRSALFDPRRFGTPGLLGAALMALLAAPAADAFCGMFVAGAGAKLYNKASQVAVVREKDRTTITMLNDYQGDPKDFALVVPVPVVLQESDVKTVRPELFERLDAFTAPRLVEYYEEDPCNRYREYEEMAVADDVVMESAGGMPDEDGVVVEAKFDVEEYKIVILSAEESTGLERWLKKNGYALPDGAAPILAPYVKQQSKFFAAKVDVKKLKKGPDGTVMLSPLQFGFTAPTFELPIRLGMINSTGLQDLIVYALSPDRRTVVVNYPNIFIPTDIELGDKLPKPFGQYYLELFSTAQDEAGGAAVLTEYAWNTSSCDPCPTEPLTYQELKELGLSTGGGVVTRLHARYSNKLFRDDFKLGLTRHDRNFQGRYILRHPWTGPITCEDPQRGMWGYGKPQSMTGNLAVPTGR